MQRSFIIFLIIALTAIGFTACQKEYSLELPVSTNATGVLQDSSGNCLGDSVYGTYYDGVQPGDTNYVQIKVNVTAAGTYSIHTDIQNGFEFADSGFFSATGINIVNLKVIGTPILNIPTTFTVLFDSTACMFTVNVQDSTGTGLGGGGGTGTLADNTWQFTTNNHTYYGPIIGAEVVTTTGTQLIVAGLVPSGSDTAFGLTAQTSTSTFDTGTYQTTEAGTNFQLELTASSNIIYAANATAPQIVTIHVTTYDAIAKTVAGTFSGNAYDANSNTVVITNGAFKADLQ